MGRIVFLLFALLSFRKIFFPDQPFTATVGSCRVEHRRSLSSGTLSFFPSKKLVRSDQAFSGRVKPVNPMPESLLSPLLSVPLSESSGRPLGGIGG
jgi:hypothetical protein